MSSRLEQFIRENREHFDSENPDPEIWNKICKEIQPIPSKKSKVFRINMIRWSAAAAIVALAALTIFYFVFDQRKENLAGNNKPSENASIDIINEINPTYAKEVYHFTQLIELKQSELKQIAKENPELYKEFLDDVNKLDSSYNALKNELPSNPNREQLLEAMIENLRLQTELLNQQLQILRNIKQSKSQNNENSKSI